jgi:hypothetical protein
LWIGESETYVANRDYDADPAKEWMVSSDPYGYVWMDESGWTSGDADSDQDIYAGYTDSAAVEPLGLYVDQESWAFAVPDPADDLVILRYAIQNLGESPLNDLYVGVFLDFDINLSHRNLGSTDSSRNLVYMSDSTGVYVAVQLLQDGAHDPPVANLTLIHNPDFVWPNGYVLDQDKYGFLSAADSEHVVTDAQEPSNWSVLASAGPCTLGVRESELVYFAIVGGGSLAELQEHADVATTICRRGIADAPAGAPDTAPIRLLPCAPNPFRNKTAIRFDLSRPLDVTVRIYDVRGRLVLTLADGPYRAARHALFWDGHDCRGRAVASGLYFLKLNAGEDSRGQRLLRLE